MSLQGYPEKRAPVVSMFAGRMVKSYEGFYEFRDKGQGKAGKGKGQESSVKTSLSPLVLR
jgi:hypothetical protein